MNQLRETSATPGVPVNDKTYREVRNKLRKYSLGSILEVALTLLHRRHASLADEMQTAPWLIMLMAKWALQDRMVHQTLGRHITPNEFIDIQQRLWAIDRDESEGPLTTNPLRFIRSLGYVQVEFQRLETIEFARWPALIANLAADHPLKQSFEATLGLTPEDFLDLTMAVYAPVIKGEVQLTMGYFASLRAAYGAKIDIILGLMARDVAALRTELSADAFQNRHTAQAVVEFPVFRNFPLLLSPNGNYYCWHPKVFARGVDEFIHNKLSVEGGAYAQAYGDVFEDYVVGLAKTTGLASLDEDEFWAVVGRDKHAVEVILRDEDCNILVEAKFGLYQDEYITKDDAGYARAKLTKLRDGVAKAVDVSERLSTHSGLSALGDRTQDFLLLVTNRQLFIPTGKQLEAMSSTRVAEIDERARLAHAEKLPIENVFILSLAEFESLMTSVTKGKARLASLLPKLAEAMRDPSGFRLDFEQMTAGHVRRREFSPLVRQALDDAMLRLATNLGHAEMAQPFLDDIENSDDAPPTD